MTTKSLFLASIATLLAFATALSADARPRERLRGLAGVEFLFALPARIGTPIEVLIAGTTRDGIPFEGSGQMRVSSGPVPLPTAAAAPTRARIRFVADFELPGGGTVTARGRGHVRFSGEVLTGTDLVMAEGEMRFSGEVLHGTDL